ncbi:hypothetical protein H8356DRAFT_1617222 [Neocallimastix lanati (nom. inval.)]|jgi:hypothetical protein|nr:hypothetical protein H8356DRAFT_1617222 [Neocallimastix sp. JGI-2020a]
MKFPKFLIPVFSLLASTAVNSYSSDEYVQCYNEIDEYKECAFEWKRTYSAEDINTFCKYFKTKKCKKFYENPFTDDVLPTCKMIHDEEGYILSLNMIKTKRAIGELMCERNGFALSCPFVYNVMRDMSKVLEKEFLNNIKEEVCYDTTCVVETKELYNIFIKELNESGLGYAFFDIDEGEKFIEYLDSDECLEISGSYNGRKTTKKTTKKTKTTTADLATPTGKWPVSTDRSGKCGPDYGICKRATDCCSKYGYCGKSDAYCGKGCQSEFGRCNASSKPSSTVKKATSTKKKVPTSTVKYRCGPQYGYCAKENECCSKYGYCGKTDAYCGNGCQSEFGLCNSTNKPTKTTKKTTSTKRKVPTSTVSGKCGAQYGACSKEGYCCSKYGYCGTSEEYCGAGCQSEFGKCNSSKTSSNKDDIPISTSSRCGPEYGRCRKANHCCSKYGYCGTTMEYCHVGCQPLYGICE